ncbi:hypothetical protein V1478_004501 [Vespula squamosa]|uniref:Uncharacterized protein n=1 Tax=Vespula squamosa TaxID=30214 RepID=A0ABD2BGD6_VESSQ
MRASEKVIRKYSVRSHESGPPAEVDEISSSVELGVRAWLREELVFIPKAGDTNVRRMKKRKINYSFCCSQRRSNTTGEKEFAAVSQQRSRTWSIDLFL